MEPGQSTRLRITERGEVPNPFFRAIARAMMPPTDSIDAYLRNMGRRFNQDVTIEPRRSSRARERGQYFIWKGETVNGFRLEVQS